jgi:hypothetical protein
MVAQHRQIADDLRRLIAESVYPPGACLPPEAELAARYGVSRGTVRQAVIALQLEGLLDTRRGARRTVLRAAPAQSLGELQSFAQWACRNGRVPGGLILRLQHKPATAEDGGRLHVAPGDPVLHVLRLRTLEGSRYWSSASSTPRGSPTRSAHCPATLPRSPRRSRRRPASLTATESTPSTRSARGRTRRPCSASGAAARCSATAT